MPAPVFGFLAFTSGSFEGAIIRDMRLANELHRRGFKVVVYWMMERNVELVDRKIPQRMLAYGLRYQFGRPSPLLDRLGRSCLIFPSWRRREFSQRHPEQVDRLMTNLTRSICDGGESDPKLVSTLLQYMKQDGVTHLLPTFAMICPFALAAKRRNEHSFEYLATFQGEEIFANYAERIGRLEDYHRRLQEVVEGSSLPSVAVSQDYIRRLSSEMGIDASRLTAIYPGIELPGDAPPPPFEALAPKFGGLKRDLPIVTYIGRQDSEKGIDLLLYAARMVQDRGVKFQLVICGGSSFGQRYRDVIKQIAQHLRVPIHHRRRIPEQMRDALYAHSHCVVYPSIHREPFGMVAAEAMARGTPVIVPALGGIQEVVQINGLRGGLTFRPWDTADLADQIHLMLTDEALYRHLSSNTRTLAAHFTVERMTDRVLQLLGMGQTPMEQGK